jgi:hypothetical protein
MPGAEFLEGYRRRPINERQAGCQIRDRRERSERGTLVKKPVMSKDYRSPTAAGGDPL